MNIEEAKKYCKQIKDKDLWKIGYVYGGEAIETVLSELEKKDDQIEYIKNEYGRTIEEKDKVINEMATYIIRNVSREKIERLTELKDKEVIWSYDIKEYFTNKVEREGK